MGWGRRPGPLSRGPCGGARARRPGVDGSEAAGPGPPAPGRGGVAPKAARSHGGRSLGGGLCAPGAPGRWGRRWDGRTESSTRHAERGPGPQNRACSAMGRGRSERLRVRPLTSGTERTGTPACDIVRARDKERRTPPPWASVSLSIQWANDGLGEYSYFVPTHALGGGGEERFTRGPESDNSCLVAKSDSGPCPWVGIR